MSEECYISVFPFSPLTLNTLATFGSPFVCYSALPLLPHTLTVYTNCKLIIIYLFLSEDGNPDSLGTLVNWRKCTFVADIVKLVQQFQEISYTFSETDTISLENHSEVCHFLAALPQLSEKELYSYSLKCEPRNALRSDVK